MWIIGQLAHELGFGDHGTVHCNCSAHLGEGRLQLGDPHFDSQLVARRYRLSELRLFDCREQDQLAGAVRNLTHDQNARDLRHRFDDQYPWHDCELRKVPGEMRLIDGDIFEADNAIVLKFEDAIYQQKRVTVGKKLLYRLYVVSRHADSTV